MAPIRGSRATLSTSLKHSFRFVCSRRTSVAVHLPCAALLRAPQGALSCPGTSQADNRDTAQKTATTNGNVHRAPDVQPCAVVTDWVSVTPPAHLNTLPPRDPQSTYFQLPSRVHMYIQCDAPPPGPLPAAVRVLLVEDPKGGSSRLSCFGLHTQRGVSRAGSVSHLSRSRRCLGRGLFRLQPQQLCDDGWRCSGRPVPSPLV
jgi:hypothetical protein